VKKRWRLVAYDVRDEKRLRRVARVLEGYGLRVQYSIFRCYLTDRDVERLRWELAQVMDREDGLLIVSLCPHCLQQLRSRLPAGGWPEDPPLYEILGPPESSTGG
jgi:CRISPR-associated protein Cas2